MKSSCLIQVDRNPLIVIRQWQKDYCADLGNLDKVGAALISYFAYWHDIKLRSSSKSVKINDIAEAHGDERSQDESLYQFHSLDDLEDGILGIGGKGSIKKAKAWLGDKGVISEHSNPNPRYKFDKTIHYLFHPEVLNKWVDDRIADKSPVTNRQVTGDSAIPKTTTKITTKITSKSICKVETLPKESSSSSQSNQSSPVDDVDPDKEELKKRLGETKAQYFDSIVEIVDVYRKVSGREKTQYFTKGALDLMIYWLKEGYKVSDFEKVINFKWQDFKKNYPDKPEWSGLKTFFTQKNFESNLENANLLFDSTPTSSRNFNDMELSLDHEKLYQGFVEWFTKNYPNIIAAGKGFTKKEWHTWNYGFPMPQRTRRNLRTEFDKLLQRVITNMEGNLSFYKNFYKHSADTIYEAFILELKKNNDELW